MALYKDAMGQLVVASSLPVGGTTVAGAATTALVNTAPWFRSLDTNQADWHPANYYTGTVENPLITIGDSTNGVVISNISNNDGTENYAAIKVKKGGVNRVKIGDLTAASPVSATTYGVQGFNDLGAEVFRMDEVGLNAFPLKSVLYKYGSSYNIPVLQEGTLDLTAATAGTIMRYIPLNFWSGGSFRLTVQAVLYHENSTLTTTRACHAISALQIYFDNATSLPKGMGQTTLTHDSTNNTDFPAVDNAGGLGGTGRIFLGMNGASVITDTNGNTVQPYTPYLRIYSLGTQPALAHTYARYITYGMADGHYNTSFTTNNYG